MKKKEHDIKNIRQHVKVVNKLQCNMLLMKGKGNSKKKYSYDKKEANGNLVDLKSNTWNKKFTGRT